ncbi:hypothetical protein Tco_0070753 [Tanacetum coccineum]
MNYINAKFESIGFECLLKINEKIVPRFVLEFYGQLEFNYNFEGHFVVNFIIQNKPFSFTLEEFVVIQLFIVLLSTCAYGMLLTRLFTHIVSNSPELSNDRYILCDRVMHPLAPHYELKTRSDHGMKRCRSSNPSSSSNVLDHPSSSHHVDENDDGNDEKSFHSNTPLPSQLINSLSNVVPRVFENLPHENQTIHSYQTKITNASKPILHEAPKGLRTIGRALKIAMKVSERRNLTDYR